MEWIIQNYDIDYPDMITEAGPIKIISENKEKEILDAIKNKIDISVNKHHSKYIFVVAHYDCAGNPETKKTQLKQLKKSIRKMEF